MRTIFIGVGIILVGCGGLEHRMLDDLVVETGEDASPAETMSAVDGSVEEDSAPNPFDAQSGGDGGNEDSSFQDRGWTRTIGGDEQDWPREVAVAHDGSVIVSGTFAGTVDFDPGSAVLLKTSEGDRDLFVLMLNSDGELLWVETINLGHSLDIGVSMTMDDAEGVVLVGQFAGTVDFDPDPLGETLITSLGQHDLFAMNLDRSGVFQWVQTFGGRGDDAATEVSVLHDGNLLIAGHCTSVMELGSDGEQILGSASFVLKLASDSGSLLWWNTLSHGGEGRVSSIVPREDGGVVCSGRFEEIIEFVVHESGERELFEAGGERDVFALSINEGGNIEWIRTFGQSGEDWASNAVLTEESSTLITGHFEHGFNFGADLRDVHESMGFWDAFVIALDREGELLWSRSVGGAEWDWGSGIVLSQSGVLVTGAFSKEVAFDPDGSQRRDSNGMWDFFLLSLDQDGGFQWARTWGGRGRDYAEQMSVGPDGSIYLIGNFQGPVDFAPCGTTSDVHTAQGGTDAFITKLMPNGCYN